MKASKFYQLTEKPAGICPVKFCRNKKGRDGNGRIGGLCNKHKTAMWRAQHPDKAAYQNLKSRARQRRVAFSLSFEEFKPFYRLRTELSKLLLEEHQIDRKEATIGYCAGNLQVITATANRAKQTLEKQKYLEKKMAARKVKTFHWIPKEPINEFMP